VCQNIGEAEKLIFPPHKLDGVLFNGGNYTSKYHICTEELSKTFVCVPDMKQKGTL
jgi:hypothetical protein